MQTELRQFIEQTRFCRETVLRAAKMLPSDEAELEALVTETIKGANQKEFCYVVLGALTAERPIAVGHLRQGAMLMPNWSYLACVAWHMTGELPEPLLEAVRQTPLPRDTAATALFVIAWWCHEHRGGVLPDGLLAAARALARHKSDQPHEQHKSAALRALAALTGDTSLATIIQQQHGLPNEAGVKTFMEEVLKKACQGSVLELLPNALPNTLSSGTTMRRAVPRIGRNEPCPCGSGKKYKHCCHDKDQERLHHSSEVAGYTREELEKNLEPHLTAARLNVLRNTRTTIKKNRASYAKRGKTLK